jgi:hypothetical protein
VLIFYQPTELSLIKHEEACAIGVDAFKIAGAVIKETKESGEYKPAA